MELVLQIVSGQVNGHGARESERRKTFGRVGGRIGRAADCEWVLPSPYVSRYHATVSHAGNTFYIESTGENGIAVNDPTQMLPRFDRRALSDGDRLFIDEMEIIVTLAGAGVGAGVAPAIPELHADPLHPASEDLDPLKRLLGDSEPLADTAERAIPWNNSSSLADHFTPPRLEEVAPSTAGTSIAEDWDDEFAALGAPDPEALNRRAAESALEAPSPITASPVPSDVLRSMLQGLIDERQARAQIAAELRLRNLPPRRTRTLCITP